MTKQHKWHKEIKEHNDDRLYREDDILMQEGANCIESLCKFEIGEAEIKQMLNEIEYLQNENERLEQKLKEKKNE